MTTTTPTPADRQNAGQNAARNEQLKQSLDEINNRLAPLRTVADGTLYVHPSGIHFHVVTKEGNSIRFMLVEQTDPSTGVVQSEIDVEEPLLLMEPYTQAMLLSLLWRPQPQRVYMAGLGGGRIPLLLHHYIPNTTIDCTDIEPGIVTVAEAFFAIRQDDRLQIAIEDGRNWLQENPIVYDIILLDVFLDKGYSPYRMTTLEFFQLCRQRLTPGGVVAINVLAGDPFIAAKARTLGEVFPNVYSFNDPSENIILFASVEHLDLERLRTRAAQLDAIHAFPFLFREIGAQINEGLQGTNIDMRNAPILTDANPPDDYFDSLPSFNSPFSRVEADLPCPCGSGFRFDQCHGKGI